MNQRDDGSCVNIPIRSGYELVNFLSSQKSSIEVDIQNSQKSSIFFVIASIMIVVIIIIIIIIIKCQPNRHHRNIYYYYYLLLLFIIIIIIISSCISFFSLLNDLGFDKTIQKPIIMKTMNVAIPSSYFIFCQRNKPWTNPDLLTI